MTEQDRKKYEEAAKKYGESFKTGEWFERIRIEAHLKGCEYAHSLLEERIKEAYNNALDHLWKDAWSCGGPNISLDLLSIRINELKKLRK